MKPWRQVALAFRPQFCPPCKMGMGKLLQRDGTERALVPQSSRQNGWSEFQVLTSHSPSLSVRVRDFLHLCPHFPPNARGIELTSHWYYRKKEIIWKNHDGRKMWDYFNFTFTKTSIFKKSYKIIHQTSSMPTSLFATLQSNTPWKMTYFALQGPGFIKWREARGWFHWHQDLRVFQSKQATESKRLPKPGRHSSTTVCQKVARFHYFSKLK